MFYINQISELLNVNEQVAREVLHNMVLDFSEASQEEFESEVLFTYSRSAQLQQAETTHFNNQK